LMTLAVAASSGSWPVGAAVTSSAVLTASTMDAGDASPVVQAKGRYKKQGGNCVWDATDGGPDQCTPRTKGRFKKGGDDSCKWDANDAGADQCRPSTGRWKGWRCTWDANDGGPDQCNRGRPGSGRRFGFMVHGSEVHPER
jgi:hypothetical protein